MQQYSVPSRQIPLVDVFDIVVVGGGPAGCTAAAAAAREGARTLLIEQTGSLGGMGTSGLVPAWCPFSDQEKVIYRGMAQRVLEATKAAMPHVKPTDVDWVPIDPEQLKLVYDDLVSEYGVTVWFNSFMAGVEMRSSHEVDAILIAGKSGLRAVTAKVFIDCTGDADLCAWAGAEFLKGNEAGELMAATHCFTLGNVDIEAYRRGESLYGGNPNSPIYAILQSGKYPLISDSHLCNCQIAPGAIGFNAGHLWNVDNTDTASVSQALMQGRKMAGTFRAALAEHAPAAFGSAFVSQTGSLMGIRETRRVVGDYVLELADYLERRSFPDEICRNSYFIDIHGSAATSCKTHAALNKWETTTSRYSKGESHGLPYRCLTPRDLNNVLVAGRSISCDRAVQGSVRVMPVCLAMGEAAGIAAQMASTGATIDVHNINVADLRSRLKAYGAYLPEPTPQPATH